MSLWNSPRVATQAVENFSSDSYLGSQQTHPATQSQQQVQYPRISATTPVRRRESARTQLPLADPIGADVDDAHDDDDEPFQFVPPPVALDELRNSPIVETKRSDSVTRSPALSSSDSVAALPRLSSTESPGRSADAEAELRSRTSDSKMPPPERRAGRIRRLSHVTPGASLSANSSATRLPLSLRMRGSHTADTHALSSGAQHHADAYACTSRQNRNRGDDCASTSQRERAVDRKRVGERSADELLAEAAAAIAADSEIDFNAITDDDDDDDHGDDDDDTEPLPGTREAVKNSPLEKQTIGEKHRREDVHSDEQTDRQATMSSDTRQDHVLPARKRRALVLDSQEGFAASDLEQRTEDDSTAWHSSSGERAPALGEPLPDAPEHEKAAHRRYQATLQPMRKRSVRSAVAPTSADGSTLEAPVCACGKPAILRTVKRNNRNFNRRFWACPKAKKQCKFFQWNDGGREWDEMTPEARREAWLKNMRGSLACQNIAPKPVNLNKDITDILEQMRAQYKNEGDKMHELGYSKAINALSRCRKRITSGKQARELYGVGDRIAAKVEEICRTGTLRQLNHKTSNAENQALDLFGKVWGAGPTTAKKWFDMGLRTLDDLRERPELLTRQQRIGLRHYHDFIQRIPRAEVAEIEQVVAKICVSIDPAFMVIACGSYRRGKKDSGDCDILISHPDGESHRSILRVLLRKLHRAGYLTDSLSISEAGKAPVINADGTQGGTQSKYHGVIRLLHDGAIHRRLDIICVPFNELGCALLYFTGNDYFNRSMRHYAKQKGMTLTQHCLARAVRTDGGKTKMHVGLPIPTQSELDVFEALGLTYIKPMDRSAQ